MDVLRFFVLVGVLVVVHELGHFLVARLFGVKVLTFSLGFGPALLVHRGRETTYQLALLPLGGFVRMLEAERPDKDAPPLSEREAARAFDRQPRLVRLAIALGGPVMNLLLAVVLLFVVYLPRASVELPPDIGTVVPGSPADGLLHPGDRVVAVDGVPVTTYGEVHERVTASPGKRLVLTVLRLVDQPKLHEERIELGLIPRPVLTEQGTVGRLGIGALAPSACIGVPDPSSPAYRAGLRTFDLVTHVGGIATPRFSDLERKLRDNPGVAVPVRYLRPRVIPVGALPVGDALPLLEMAAYEASIAVVAPEVPPTGTSGGGLTRAGIESSDLYVSSVPTGSSEWLAGLRPGDRLRSVDGVSIPAFVTLIEDLGAQASRTRLLEWTRDGRPMTGLFRLRHEEWVDVTGRRLERDTFPSQHFVPTMPVTLIDQPVRLRSAASRALAESGHAIRFIAVSTLRILGGQAPLRSLAGPISLYDAAGRAGARGLDEYLWVMAVISINLGLLNLLPIPTLDGGQLLFLGAETVLRRPLSLRVRDAAGLVGLLLLAFVMIVAVRNDLQRLESVTAPVPSD